MKSLMGAAGAACLALAGCAYPRMPLPALTADVPIQTPEVKIDQRVELLAIIFRLAGAPEYSGRQIAVYADAIEQHFESFREHPAVEAAKGLREQYGISHNAVADLAIHLSSFPELQARVPLGGSQLDPRWQPEAAYSFLAHVRAFAVDSNAAEFFDRQRPLYRVAERRMRNVATHEADLAWVRAYYGGEPEERFIIVPAPGNGSVAYGPRFYGASGEREFYAIMNMWQTDEDGWPSVGFSTAYTLVHEFSHSYVTPLIVERYEELRPAGEALLAHFGDEMRAHGYTRGDTILHESIIRAAVARYKLAHVDDAAARNELDRQRRIGFLWIEELYNLLAFYEQHRNRYPTFRDFYPEVRTYFQQLAPQVPAIAAAYETHRPRIVEFVPTSNSSNVDPSTKTITMKFDRPMRRSWGFRSIPGQVWPGKNASMNEAATVLTLEVDLQPNTRYEIAPLPSQFMSTEGVPLAPVTLTFTTGPRR